jgi:hypothetical protein
MKYECPCCKYQTLDEQPPGTFLICPVCYWEDDNVQFSNLDDAGGTNEISLKQAQKNFLKFGTSDKKFITKVRKPTKQDRKVPI